MLIKAFGISQLVRQFSSTAQCYQLVKPPVQVFGIEGRYASALYSAATKEKKLEAVEKEILDFQKLVKTDKKVAEILLDPTIKKSLKADVIESITKKFNTSPLTSNLLLTLVENGRIKNLTNIVSSFKTIMAAVRGEVVCEVITAKPLDQSQNEELQSALKSFLKKGETIQLTTKVDPSLVGGMIVSIGDKYIDMSLASKLKNYTGVLQSAL